MARESSPAFQFYPLDWLGDSKVQAMSVEAEGTYIRLICYCWQDGKLPADIGMLARLTKLTPKAFARVWPELQPCFVAVEGGWVQKRVERERTKQEAFRARSSEHGLKGARARWERSPSNARVMPEHDSIDARAMPNDGSSSSSLSSSLKQEQKIPPTPQGGGEDFESFWKEYPRKIGKNAAKRAFDKCHIPLSILLPALELQRQSAQWQRDGGQFIPHPSTWLNQGRWQDEAEVTTADMPISEEEFQTAAEVRRKAWGRCPHEPPCVGARECVLLIAMERRSA